MRLVILYWIIFSYQTGNCSKGQWTGIFLELNGYWSSICSWSSYWFLIKNSKISWKRIWRTTLTLLRNLPNIEVCPLRMWTHHLQMNCSTSWISLPEYRFASNKTCKSRTGVFIDKVYSNLKKEEHIVIQKSCRCMAWQYLLSSTSPNFKIGLLIVRRWPVALNHYNHYKTF